MQMKPVVQAPMRKEPPLVGYSREGAPREPYVEGFVELAGRAIPRVATRLSARDRRGALRVRWGIGRNRYRVQPGLYAVGEPKADSPLLVTANYKLSFDALRSELAGLHVWILVLDTKGINVWCAAGKGSFGSAELLDKLARLRLKELLSQRLLILPQLAAPGVSAPEVQKVSGFRIVYGPVRARDIPRFLAAGMKKDSDMRRVRFGLAERAVLAPVEIVHALPFAAAALGLALILALPATTGYAARAAAGAAVLLGAVLLGALGFPLLLPLLPFRAFALKGALLGLLWGAGGALLIAPTPLGAVSLVLASGSVVSYLGLNFTGSSSFTNQKGASLEVERGILPLIIAAALALVAAVAAALFGI